jgi:hypothetical protein
MSACCDRAIGALLLSCDSAGGDPMWDVIYRQRLARLRRDLWRFRRDQQLKSSGFFKLTHLKWRKSS